MLSKIIKKGSVLENLERFIPPEPQKLRQLVEERRMFAEREKVLRQSGSDPIAAAKQEAHRILQEAQQKLKEAEVEAALIIQKRETEWQERRDRELEKELQLRLSEVKEKYYQSIEELGRLRGKLFEESKKELTELVFSIARKVLQNELSTHPEHIFKMLGSAFQRLRGARSYKLHIHPEDQKVLLSRRQWLQENAGASAEITIVPDESVERGGCRIISDRGESSTELSRQLEIIRKEL